MADSAVTLVTGPPGAGKTTVARLYADRLAHSVHLHTDDFWANIRQGAIAPYLPESQSQNEIVIGVVVQAAFGYAAGGYQVIADGVVGPWFVDAFRSATRLYGIDLHYVILRPDADTTVARGTARDSQKMLTETGPLREMHRAFTELGPYESHVLDNTGLDPAETADRVAAVVESGQARLDSWKGPGPQGPGP